MNPKLAHHIENAWKCFGANQYRATLHHAQAAEKINANLPETWYLRSIAHSRLGDLERSFQIANDALNKFPEHPNLLSLQGGNLVEMHRYEDAEEMLLRAIELKPDVALAWSNMSWLKVSTWDHAETEKAARKAIELAPTDWAAQMNLSVALKEMGHVSESLDVLKKLTSTTKTYGWTNLLFYILFDEGFTPEFQLKLARQYAEKLRVKEKNTGLKTLPGKLRLGIMSNDLYNHACAYFLIPFISNLDRSIFEIYLLSLNKHHDNITKKFHLLSDHFINLAGMADDDVVRTTRDQALDVLIDTGGYTGVSPLQYMVRRLAPIQVTWLGYPASTGMKEIDLRITDNTADPIGYDSHYSEKLLRAPGSFCVFYPLVKDPLAVYSLEYKVHQAPCVINGYVTFGSCNNIAKITQKTLRIWARVLEEVPNSKIFIEAGNLDKQKVKENLLIRMVSQGIASDRIVFEPREGRNQYLTYNKIDIVLDTAPLTGGTTTCDALWMGVPVVSLAGDTFHSRISATFLNAVGLGDLICASENEYVQIAKKLAIDVERLSEIRKNLRPNFERSALQNSTAFCKWFTDEIVERVESFKKIIRDPAVNGDGVYFNGVWHAMPQVKLACSQLLEASQFSDLRILLENISSKWSRHWVVAFCLSEMQYRLGFKDFSLILLSDAVALRVNSLNLWRLLYLRLLELGKNTAGLVTYIKNNFGLEADEFLKFSIPDASTILMDDRY